MRIVKPQMSTTINNNNSSWKERLPEETDSRIDVGNYASAKIEHGAGLRGVAAFANLPVTKNRVHSGCKAGSWRKKRWLLVKCACSLLVRKSCVTKTSTSTGRARLASHNPRLE